jgi:hypothetical protein
MERYGPKAICCGVPIVWVRCGYWEDEVWEGECAWCKREFAYFDSSDGTARGV